MDIPVPRHHRNSLADVYLGDDCPWLDAIALVLQDLSDLSRRLQWNKIRTLLDGTGYFCGTRVRILEIGRRVVVAEAKGKLSHCHCGTPFTSSIIKLAKTVFRLMGYFATDQFFSTDLHCPPG